MSRRDGLDDGALAQALRALPESAPTPDLWPELARSLAARKRRRAWLYALPPALAAGVALALLIPRAPSPDAPPAPTTVVATPSSASDADELAALHRRSQSLERWIAAVAARAPQDGRDLMAAVEIEDLIGLVDLQLGGARDESDALPLWRQRVALLEDLAAVRSNAFALAGGDSARPEPVSLNLMN